MAATTSAGAEGATTPPPPNQADPVLATRCAHTRESNSTGPVLPRGSSSSPRPPAGPLTLDRITDRAAKAGAKVLLVGDWAQLQSVEAGGAFAMLVDAQGDVCKLVDIHHVAHEWEKATSLALRHGQPEAVDPYLSHNRIREGTHEDLLNDAYAAWQTRHRGQTAQRAGRRLDPRRQRPQHPRRD